MDGSARRGITNSSAVTVVVPTTNRNITESRNVAILRPPELSVISDVIKLEPPPRGSSCEDYVAALSDFGGVALAQLDNFKAKITPEEYTEIKETFKNKISKIIIEMKNSKTLTECQGIFEEYVKTLPKRGGKRNTRRRKLKRRKTQRRR